VADHVLRTEPHSRHERRRNDQGRRDRDLGFWRGRQPREPPAPWLNRDGSFNVNRSGLGFFAKLRARITSLLTASWAARFLGGGDPELSRLEPRVRLPPTSACGPDALLGSGAADGWAAGFAQGLLLQHSDVRDDWLRSGGAERHRGETSSSPSRPSSAWMYQALATGPAVRAVHPAGPPCCSFKPADAVWSRPYRRRAHGPDVPDRETSGANEIIELQAQVLFKRRRAPTGRGGSRAAANVFLPPRTEQGHLLSAVRGPSSNPTRRGEPAGQSDERRISSGGGGGDPRPALGDRRSAGTERPTRAPSLPRSRRSCGTRRFQSMYLKTDARSSPRLGGHQAASTRSNGSKRSMAPTPCSTGLI